MLLHIRYQLRTGRRQQGFTLVELVVVLAVLVTLVGLLLSNFGSLRFSGAGESHTVEEVATAATLNEVRDAIIGSSNRAGLWQDLGERPSLFPHVIADLFVTNNLSSYGVPPAHQHFDPMARLGWHGPYLVPGGKQYSINSDLGFTSVYGASNDPAVSDAWGRPIVLQIPTLDGALKWSYARLVSAGPDGKINTPPNQLSPTDSDRNDDVVLFLMVNDTHGQE